MSAVRTDRRSTKHGRAGPASPYSRQQPPKKSSWSLGGLLSYLNPLRLRASSTEDEDDEEANASFSSLPTMNERPAKALSVRGKEMAKQLTMQQSSPPHVSPPASLPESQNPLLSINEYLQNKKNMSETEVQQLADYVQRHASPVKKHEPFRFTSVPPTTPSVNTSQSLPDMSKTSKPSRRTITRNPNGVYRWEGSGSARRNRYSSPAFGSSGSVPGPRLKLQPPLETPKKDTKRRRVGDDPSTSSAQPATPDKSTPTRSNAPSPSQPPANYPFPTSQPSSTAFDKTPSKVNSSRSLPALRTPVAKPTMPVIPSPLRQAWGQGDSPPQPPLHQTKAASFMAGLIKEVVVPPKPDVSNPYQTASPVKPPVQPRKVSAKRPRATGKPTLPASVVEEKKETQPELSPQAIIEATVPKGSKRSRPPVNLSEPAVEEPTDNSHTDLKNEQPVQKKSKKATLNGHGPPPTQSVLHNHFVTVEEVEDDDDIKSICPMEVIEAHEEPPKTAPVQTIQTTGIAKQPVGPKSSIPREPSKLRFSFQPETNGSAASSISSAPEQKQAPTEIDAKDVAKTSGSTPGFTFSIPESDPIPASARNAALKAINSTVPSFVFTPVPLSSIASTSAAAIAATRTEKGALPSFSFSLSSEPTVPTLTPTTTAGFNWAAAGVKPPTSSPGWKCDTCMCDNPASIKDKCSVCEAPAPASASSTHTGGGFNWSAAGVNPQSSTNAVWNCSTCMCNNPASVKDKCSVCEAPAPGASSSKPIAAGGFNWAAAGMKAPVAAGWKCSICMCDNEATATTKCQVCDTTR